MTYDGYLPAGVNGLLSAAIVFICICRARKINRTVLWRVRVGYIGLLMGAAANGFSPWLWELPSWPSVAFAFAVVLKLAIESRDWRDGPPFTSTGPAPLGDFPEISQ